MGLKYHYVAMIFPNYKGMEKLKMNHRISFVVETMRDDTGETAGEKGNAAWLPEGHE
jgi:hypothetical protein